jgi:hypothetical protein
MNRPVHSAEKRGNGASSTLCVGREHPPVDGAARDICRLKGFENLRKL